MTGKFAVVAGALFSVMYAGSLLAQSPAATKTAPKANTMQHAQPSTPSTSAAQDTSATSSKARTTTQHAVWTKEQIKEAQQGLAKAGYFKGQPNGVYGKKTRKAIREYQKANKLPVTGRLSDDLLARLRSV
jgi:peptidoglycan hydrolase-like protein with peptidoglycan-binding domain